LLTTLLGHLTSHLTCQVCAACLADVSLTGLVHVLPQLQQSRQSEAQKSTEAKEGQENQVVDALETRLRAQITALETALESTALGMSSFPASTGTCFVLLLLLSERLVNKHISSVCVSQVQ